MCRRDGGEEILNDWEVDALHTTITSIISPPHMTVISHSVLPPPQRKMPSFGKSNSAAAPAGSSTPSTPSAAVAAASPAAPAEDPVKTLFAQGLAPFVFPSVMVLAHVNFLYEGYKSMVGKPDPLGAGLPLSQTASMVAVYISMVYTLYSSRASRQSMDVSAAMFIYNIYETLLSACAYIFIRRML
jgi:hypothetical protein